MSTFSPSSAVDPSKERDWAAQLGMLDWDDTKIVFTKRSLIEFLKHVDVTVDPSFKNIQKLPRYAEFGKLASGGLPASASAASDASSASAAPDTPASEDAADFKPTRRVRDPPGGVQSIVFGGYDQDDALSRAPPKSSQTVSPVATASAPAAAHTKKDSVADLLGDAPVEPASFKPTRRVREMPGGKDSISGLWS